MTFRRIGKTGMGMLAVAAAIFLASCFNAPPMRDNVIVHSIKLEHGQRMVIVDNAGIGGTSDVEITWRFDSNECLLQTLNDANGDGTATFNPVTPDSPPAYGNNPAHRDVSNVEAVLLVSKKAEECKIDPNHGEFVTVSTVGSAGPIAVSPPNTPPTITSIADQMTPHNTAVGPITFTVGDAETAAGSLTVTVTSSNQTLIPDANLALGGTGADRTITVTPATSQSGTATITVQVTDTGGLSRQTTFTVTVGEGPVVVPPKQIVISGVSGDGPNRWTITVDGVAQLGSEVNVQPGDVITWQVESGFHGVTFQQFSDAETFLQFDPPPVGLPIIAHPQWGAGAQGTDGANEPTLLARATVKVSVLTELPFICTVHGPGMNGKLLK